MVNDPIIASPANFSLSGKHVVVTGGGRGIGQSIALSVVNAGAHVTVLARTGSQLAETVELSAQLPGTCSAITADISDTESLASIVDQIEAQGPINGLVHAAATQLRKPAVEVEVHEWRQLQSINMDAPFFLSTAVARHQLEKGRAGSHVFIGSLNSTIGLPRLSPYATSKTALLGMARVMSTEWSAFGLRANVIGPGYFHTKMTDDLFADPQAKQRVLSRIPSGKLGNPSDIGALAVFLLSDASNYITGQLLNVDGGWLAS